MMLNQELYMQLLKQKAESEPPEAETGLALVTDPAVIAEFERESGLTAGVLANPPYYNICMDVYRTRNTGRCFRYCNVTYSRQGAAVLVLVRTKNEAFFLLNRQYRPFLHQTVLEIPRGFADPDDPDAAYTAVRELAEETGLNLFAEKEQSCCQITELGTVHPDSGLTNSAVALILAEIRTDRIPEFAVKDENETILGHLLVTEAELSDMIADERITDGFTLSAYAKYRAKRSCR
ncbi:MAG: NUDIX hydrolase [Oscillospiraceae bacterium]|nr:NUDIX hydrolase [Oscillospiraceae bacterium]